MRLNTTLLYPLTWLTCVETIMILTDFWLEVAALCALGDTLLGVATLVVAVLDAIDWISFTKLDKSDILYGRYFVYALGV